MPRQQRRAFAVFSQLRSENPTSDTERRNVPFDASPSAPETTNSGHFFRVTPATPGPEVPAYLQPPVLQVCALLSGPGFELGTPPALNCARKERRR